MSSTGSYTYDEPISSLANLGFLLNFILNYTFSSLTWHNLPSIVCSPQRRSLHREETLAEVVYLYANTETTEFRPQHMQISQEAKAIAGSVI